MKNLITYLKALWGAWGNLQSSDVSHDCRRSDLRRSPSGLDAKWKQNPFMRFAVVLTIIFTIGVGQMWAAVGDAITAHGNIADATVYYLSGKATVSSKTYTYYSVLASDEASSSVTGNATTTQASGTKYTFLIESGKYYLVTPKGYYVEPHGSSNGKLILTTDKKAVTVSTKSSLIRITGTTNTGKSIQKNKTTAANFGSYGNTQNDLTLYVAGYRVIYDANGATGGTVPTDATVYADNASATIKANTGSLVKTGYTFAGWNTAANGSGTDVAASGSATRTITAGLRLYAKWAAAASCDAPSAPSNGSVSGTGVTISTTSSSANYDIYYSTSSTAPTTQDPTATISSGNSKAITGLSYGTTYYYWMRQNCGGGSTSSWVAGSPTNFTTTVPAPTGVSAGSLTMDGATFTITDDNNVNNYDIYYSTNSTAPVAGTAATTTSTSKTKAVSGLAAGTYYYWVRAKGPNAKSAWVGGSTFTTLTLSSISVSTAPTKTKYLVGDNFDPTGLVITRTYSNSTSDTYSYAGHTSEFSFSPATNAALTAENTSVTISYGGKSTSQAINVYTVTVNKVNMSGTAITNANVTATCSGRTLSQSVGSTNYKFNSWNVTAGGVSISDNSITGTPTGNVTINAKFHDPITVTWKVGSGAASGGTSEVKYGTAITALPSTPADNALASCGTNKFMGWTALGELKGTGNDAPADLFTSTSDAGCAALTENTTYRAVFANQTGGGATVNTVMYSETFEGYSAKDVPSGSVSTSSTNRVVYNSGSVTYTCVNGNSDTKIYTDNLAEGDGVTELLVGKSGGSFTVAGIPSGGAATLTVTYKTNAKSMTVSTTGTGYSGSCTASTKEEHSFDVTVGSVSTFTLTFTPGSDNVRLDDIKVKVKTAGTTTSDYQTGCCTTAPGTALSITSANSVATGGTVSLTSTGGNGGTVTWSVVNGTGTATVAGTTLTAGSIGTVTVKAHQDANTVLGTEYCAQDAEQAFTVVSSTVNVTGVTVAPTTKAIIPGETFTITPTISPSNATDKSVSWTSSASDKASVSSGTVTGVAAGTATITCTTTDGSKTATTAVTVYGVTMQALDEDGNAIAVGGPGTPSRTGASISPAADAGNYVFKEWAISGASLGSSASTKANTITNPTGAVTVTAKYYKPRTVKWSVNGDDSYATGEPTTTVAYNGTISTVPTNPSGLACASTFIAWTDAAHNNGQTAKDDDSYYGSALYTAAGDFPNITAETTTFYAVFAEGGGAAVNTVMWSEDWTGATSSSGSGTPSPSDARPSAQGDHSGKTVYGGATITYTDGTGTYVRTNEKNAGGTAPELLIKSNENWTISGIPTGGAATLTLEYRTNGTLTVSTSTDNVSIGTKSGSNPYTNTITVGSGVTSFNLSFTETSNRRIDNVSVKVASVSLTNYVTECDPNIVKVTYNANSGTTSCTNTTTDKTEDFTVCSSAPTRDYYTFAGWLCSADSKTYAASATIPAAAIDADFTLTAQWTPVPYSITYELYGGTNSGSNPATYNVTTATITLQDPTKGHDRFEGWYSTYSAGVYSDQVTSIPLGSHGDITLHAKWAERHEIIFDADGVKTTIYRADDENMEDAVAGQGSVPSDPSAPTACSSKVFVGWSESTIDGETDTEPGDLMKPAAGTVDADKHYYAVWAIESSESGTVTVFNDAFQSVSNGSDYQDNKAKPDKYTTNKVYGTGSAGEARMSSSSASGSISVDLSGEDLESTITVSFKLKYWSDSESGSVSLSCMDDGNTASFSNSSFAYPSTSGWKDFSSTVTNVDDKVESITFNSTSGKRVYIKDIVITQTGTIYSYSAYSTSCCATKVTLSDPSITGTGATITFDKVSPVATCDGSKTVTATVTVTAGYQVTELSFSGGSVSVSPTISTPITSTTNYTLTFAEGTNATLTTTATAGAKPLNGITITPSSGEVYVGQYVDFTVSYDPADYINPGYTLYATPVYVTKESAAPANTKLRLKGGRGSGPGASITETVNETVTIKASGDNTKTASVNMTVNPLPRVHFEDLVHGKAFADVEATIAENALNPNKTTKTSVDWVTPNANTCEENHLHLVGWIRSDWPALVAYLNGTGDAPTTTAIVGAGNDGSGHAYYFAAGASINVQIFDGVTFYAVWSKVE